MSASYSLPLMGIRNQTLAVQGAILQSQAHYPSWGSGTPAPPWRCGLPRSAHYPSWGSGTIMSASTIRPIFSSLPLMGIRNPDDHRGRPVGRDRSLPLMGIRNHAGGDHAGDRDPSHYPSWGSGTWAAAPTAEDTPELTTPHGDQEQEAPPGRHRRPGRSLPLMGIRNGNRPLNR